MQLLQEDDHLGAGPALGVISRGLTLRYRHSQLHGGDAEHSYPHHCEHTLWCTRSAASLVAASMSEVSNLGVTGGMPGL